MEQRTEMEACGSRGPGDLENYIHRGWKASRSLSVHREDEQIQREAAATQRRLANKPKIQDLTPVS